MVGEQIKHPYQRDPGFDGEDSISVLARRIKSGDRVLDIGAGQGALGRLISQCRVDGIDVSAEAAEIAAECYENFLIRDLNSRDALDSLLKHEYDVVVCADVLEHLVEPESFVPRLAQLLKPGGKLLVSLPNVAYAGLIADLLCGEFNYTETGLLDRTHLHFYTCETASLFLNEAGFHIDWIGRVSLDLRSSEFSHRHLDAFPPALRKALLGRSHALDYQLVFEVTPADGREQKKLPTIKNNVSLQFFSELFWRTEEQEFLVDRSKAEFSTLAEYRQQVSFNFHIGQQALYQLRFDPADRPGVMHVYRIELIDEEGHSAWLWDGQTVFSSNDVLLSSVGDVTLLYMTGNDPQLIFEPFLIGPLNGSFILQVDISWPCSADCLPLIANEQEGNLQVSQLEKRNTRLLSELDEKQAQINQLRQLLTDVESFSFMDWFRWQHWRKSEGKK